MYGFYTMIKQSGRKKLYLCILERCTFNWQKSLSIRASVENFGLKSQIIYNFQVLFKMPDSFDLVSNKIFTCCRCSIVVHGHCFMLEFDICFFFSPGVAPRPKSQVSEQISVFRRSQYLRPGSLQGVEMTSSGEISLPVKTFRDHLRIDLHVSKCLINIGLNCKILSIIKFN